MKRLTSFHIGLINLLAFIIVCATTYGQGLEAVVQKGHTDYIQTFVFSPDSLFVVTGSRDKTAKLWEYKTGRELKTFNHDFRVVELAFSPDGKQLMTLSEDNTIDNQWICLWELATGMLLYKFNNREGIEKIAFGLGYWVFGGNIYMKILDAKKQTIINQLDIRDNDTSDGKLQISKDGKWFALLSSFKGSLETKVDIYSIPELKLTYTIETNNKRGTPKIRFDPFSKHLYIISRVGPFKKIDLATGRVVLKYEKVIREDSGMQFSTVDVSPDGKSIFVGTRDNGFDVKMWDIETGKDLANLNIILDRAVNHITFTPEGDKFIFTTTDSSELQIIDFKNKPIRTIGGLIADKNEGTQFFGDGHGINGLYLFMDYKNPISFVGHGNKLIKARFGSKAVLWNASTGKKEKVFAGHKNSLFCYDLSQDGKRMVTGGGDGKIILWDMELGDTIKVIQAYYRNMAVMDIHFNPDNEDQVISSCADTYDYFKTVVRIHSLSTGKQLVNYKYPKLVNPISWNHLVIWGKSDSYLYKATDSTIHLLETRTGQSLRTLQGHKKNISSVSLSSE
jgi:WD40 repeat protein